MTIDGAMVPSAELVSVESKPRGEAETKVYEPMAQTVARHLRDSIFNGRLAPGARIGQEAVAQELGVSRIPVREALRQLEIEGLVTIRPHSGARVAVLDFDECIEIYKVRERIEPLAFGESIGNMTSEQVEAVRSIAFEIESLAPNTVSWLEADRRFHLACYAGARLRRLVHSIMSYWNTTQQYRRLLVEGFTPDDFEVVHADHRLMVTAVETANARAGEEILRIHIERGRLGLAQDRELFDR